MGSAVGHHHTIQRRNYRVTRRTLPARTISEASLQFIQHHPMPLRNACKTTLR